MEILDISLQDRVIIGISAMVLLFTSFLVVFITNQRKKIRYHKNLQAMHAEQQQMLREQNVMLEQRVKERTAELSEQKEVLQKALEELRNSQIQLIQKEKMASLGELTSGIAHEIQNPLNFVLNFGEINLELANDLKTQLNGNGIPEKISGELKELASDFSDNMSRILQHGRRAEGIVRNMLQHSRKHSGIAEHKDLNELADEYLELCYKGFRSKNPQFSCVFQKDLDKSIGRINLVQDDIGHVLTNLYNNAFYSMNDKLKKNNSYQPELTVQSDKQGNKVILTVTDNGMGIPATILPKIFQPFFTTKPTGMGTGLGLSLSYDMMKSNKGELKAESVEGEYARFTMEINE